MEKRIREILTKYRQNEGYTMEHAERELFSLFSVTVLFEEGYKKGWSEATSEACKEIEKHYKPNER